MVLNRNHISRNFKSCILNITEIQVVLRVSGTVRCLDKYILLVVIVLVVSEIKSHAVLDETPFCSDFERAVVFRCQVSTRIWNHRILLGGQIHVALLGPLWWIGAVY